MSWLDGARYRLYTLFAARRHERDVEEEMRFHLALDAMHEGDAYRARRRFGNLAYYREEMRRIGLRGRLDALEQDVRYAWRAIVRTPLLSLTVVITLALGIGVNVALFSLLDRLLLRPPSGVVDPDNVFFLYQTQKRPRTGEPAVSPVANHAAFLAMRNAIGAAGAIAPFADGWRASMGRAEGAPRITVTFAGAEYFALLGVRPALGRFFVPDESRASAPAPVAVVSHRLWQRWLRADSSVIGQTIDIAKHRFRVIGIAPADFTGVDLGATDVWLPFGTSLQVGQPAYYMGEYTWAIHSLVRPRPGVDPRRIAAAATAGLRASEATLQDTAVVVTPVSLIPARGYWKELQEVSIAFRLTGVAVAVLLIACANVANLLLARAVTRRREIAVRLALGVSRRRLISLLLSESVLLALLSGIAALLVGVWAGGALRALLMPDVNWAGGVFDGRLATFAALAAIVTGILAGLAPAWRASRAEVGAALKAGARERTLARSRLRTGLVVAQGALSVVLLVAAGLFVRSLQQVRGLDIGYDARGVIFVGAYFDEDPANWKHRIAEMAPRLPLIVQRLAAIPGVERVGVTSVVPLRGVSFQPLYIPGGRAITLKSGAPSHTAVSPGAFAALGLRLLQGRDVGVNDRKGAPAVVVVNETMARTIWPHESAIGKCIRVGSDTVPCATVVGVVENARRSHVIEEPTMQYYLAHAQLDWEHPSAELVIRAPADRATAVAELARREIRAVLPGVDIGVRRIDEIVSRELRPWRMGATLFLAFGLLAVVVAAIGVYSTTSYTVGQRTHEMGIRRALGAQAAHMLRLVIGAELRIVAFGIVLGIGLSLALRRFVESLLYGVSASDPVVLAAVVVLLAMISTLACLAPALRAARVDPAVTLRAE